MHSAIALLEYHGHYCATYEIYNDSRINRWPCIAVVLNYTVNCMLIHFTICFTCYFQIGLQTFSDFPIKTYWSKYYLDSYLHCKLVIRWYITQSPRYHYNKCVYHMWHIKWLLYTYFVFFKQLSTCNGRSIFTLHHVYRAAGDRYLLMIFLCEYDQICTYNRNRGRIHYNISIPC